MTILKLFAPQRQAVAALMACFMYLGANAANANQWQAHSSIYAALNSYAIEHLGGNATSTNLDERTHYPLCKKSLQVSLPFSNNKTAKISCTQSVSSKQPQWSIYLSIKVHSKIEAWRVIKPIAAMEQLTREHLRLETHQSTNLGLLGANSNPTGKQVKRQLNAGHWLSSADLNEVQNAWAANVDLKMGSVIAAHHIKTIKVNESLARPNLITDRSALIGKLARRYIRAGKTLDTGDVEDQQKVLVSSRPLSAGRTLIASDLELALLPNHLVRKAGFNAASTVIGRVTLRHIAAGAHITADMLRKAYLVVKGHRVTLQINKANYQITSAATALSNGNLGDKISVRVMQSGVEKPAIVTAKGIVELER